ncbi:MAG: DUF4199 domain-containing protein [Flavobacteriales bacterium]|nr:DUF4199 domain-containing protein [Flavobacteriales bacterium]
MKNTIIKYGSYSGLTIVGILAITSLIGYEKIGFKYGELIGYSSMVLSFLFIFFGIRQYKAGLGDEPFTFMQAFKMGILMSLIASAIYVAGWLFINKFIYPDFMEDYTNYYIESQKSKGVDSLQLQTMITEIEKNKEMLKNPLVNILITFFEIFPVGILVSLVSAIILRKNQGTTPLFKIKIPKP